MDPISYEIDGDDVVVHVNEAWQTCLPNRNGDPNAVAGDAVIGKKLWVQVTDGVTIELYREIIRRARSGVPVQFHFRCDSAAARQVFRMDVERVAQGRVRFTSTLAEQQERAPVALLDSERKRSSAWVRICSWCQRVAVPEGIWVPIEQAVDRLGLMSNSEMPRLTHGICPDCESSMRKMIEDADSAPGQS